MKIQAITSTLQHEMSLDINFAILFSTTLIPEISKMNEIDDYCLFIDFIMNDNLTQILIHDGGATYDEKIHDMVQADYLSIESDLLIKNSYRLYYSIDEEIICFLNER